MGKIFEKKKTPQISIRKSAEPHLALARTLILTQSNSRERLREALKNKFIFKTFIKFNSRNIDVNKL